MKVNFFIIGAPKCGTTALAQYLSEHPGVCFSKPKEPGFFNAEQFNLDVSPKTVEEYHARIFSHFNPDLHQVLGEGTTNYLYYKKAVPRIVQYNPNAKLIVMLRNPIDMLVSWHQQMLRWFDEDEMDLEKAWALQSQRAEGKRMPKGDQFSFDLQYKANCLLGSQVERLLSVVDRSRVRFCLMDDLASDPRSVYKDMCEFIGITDDERTDFERINVGKVWNSAFVRDAYMSFYRVKTLLLGGQPIPFSLDRKLRSIFMKDKKRIPEMTDEFRALLKKEFCEDIKLLASLIGRDLSGWLT